ncbi:MAG: ATP-binding protein [Phycisphaerales bacterium]|nr:ATP-binding protein [Phycisphaerales bacterium]
MLTHVDLARYRGFKTYKVRGLSRVNLFVGMNNSGKTALLEGIQFLASGGDPSVLAQSAIRRGEVVVRRPDAPTLVEIAHFFFGHQIEPEADFSITGNNGYTPVTVKVISLEDRQSKSEDLPKVPRRVGQFAIKIDGGRRRTPEPRIYPLTREGVVQMEDPAPWRFEGYERLLIDRMSRFQGSPSYFIGTDQVDSVSLALMMDEVAMLGRDSMLADAMRLLDPKLEYARMLSGASTLGFRGSKGGVIAKLQGVERPVPLGSLGEGMRRMLTLASALSTTRGGYLFIDEVDTGLHYSVMAKMWELIITTATAYDIQVFASTHSYDCIYGLAKLFRKQPDLKQVFSVQRIEAERQDSVAFEPEEILAAIREDIEIR